MSACIVLFPLIAPSAWPLLVSSASFVAHALGYSFSNQISHKQNLAHAVDSLEEQVEWLVQDTKELGKTLSQDDEFTIKSKDIVFTCRKTARGRCKITVRGKNKTKLELKEEGEKILNQIMQKFSYEMVKREIERQNLKVVNEENLEDGSIRIRVRKWV